MSISNKTVIIATKNRGKSREIKEILKIDGVKYLDLYDLDFNDRIVEYGRSFEENALIKAAAIFDRYRKPVVADDSGLEVEALNGRPGVYSARYAGENATDRDNNELLLEELLNLPDIDRKARFVCVAVFYYDVNKYDVEKGEVEGYITHNPVGDQGFGYDPIFYLPDLKKTMAELTPEEKNKISHRGKAFRRLKSHIIRYFNER